MINYGVVYPQAILMFVITMLYSVVQPLIVIFGAIYFGVGYVVYKYKLLFGGFNAPCFLMLSEADFSRKFSTNPTNLKAKPGLSLSSDLFGAWLSSYSL